MENILPYKKMNLFSRSKKEVDGREVLKDLNKPSKPRKNTSVNTYGNDDAGNEHEARRKSGKPKSKNISKGNGSSKSKGKRKISSRIKSIDVIRGMTIALMVVGNTPGNWDRLYPPLKHAKWNGVTLADFGFPFFVMLLGTTIPISIDNSLKKNKSYLQISMKIIKRSLLLVILGLFLNYLRNSDLETMRYLGVLQRMGLVYFVTSFFYLFMKKMRKKNIAIGVGAILISAIIIVGYYFVAKPYGFELNGCLAQRVDMLFFKGHLYKPDFDPDGFLTSIVAISTGMLGCTIGCILNSKKLGDYKKCFGVLLLGIALFVASVYANDYFPYNKRLWSSSFVLLMAGSYAIMLSILYLICDIFKVDKIFTPLIALGSSPIMVYVVSEALVAKLFYIEAPSIIDPSMSSYVVINFTTKYITPWAGTTWDSLAFSLIFLLMWFIIAMFLYKKKIFIKV